jgi:nitroimidazol reductase NimA-like FMN-containing flavoprotein (pyridoxamine 5'-phosphate oxidase superfamily)
MTIEPRPGVAILEPRECWLLLRHTEVGRLAVAVGGHPDIFPVNFVVDRGAVVFRTAEGTKLVAAVLGHAVAFECDGYEPATGEAWSVVVKGRATEMAPEPKVFATRELPLFPWHAAPKPRFVRIEGREVTGRRFHVVDPTTWDTPVTGSWDG